MAHWWQTIPWRMVQTNLPNRAMADMDAGRFARDLAGFGATVVNLNAAGIMANYPTQLDFQPRNPYLSGDSLADVVAACHAQGIRVIARTDFSRIQREVYEQHPGWAARQGDGSVVDYHGFVSTCPNGDYQGQAMYEVLRELFAAIPFDGLYCNMSSVFMMDYDGNFHGVCQCDTCRALYEQETGRPAPRSANPRDPALGPYIAFQMRCSARRKAKLNAFLKGLNPELALDGVDFVRSETSMDYGSPNWVYKASSNARLAAGPNRDRPSDGASVDFLGFRHRYVSAPPALMALRQWQNLANSGCLSLYIMGRLDTHRDTSSFAPTRRVFQFHKEHEALFAGLRSAARVLLVHSGSWQRMDDEAKGWVRVLTESHIPFDELAPGRLNASLLAGKRLVILPDLPRLTADAAAALDEFVAAGGTLLATGGTALGKGSAPLDCLGIDRVCEVRRDLRASMLEIPAEQAGQFPRCAATPFLDLGGTLWCVQPKAGAQTWLRLIPEHPFGPPEVCWYGDARENWPGLVVQPYGKGRSFCLPWRGAAVCAETGTDNPLRFLQDVLFAQCGLPDLAPGLTPMVELTLTQKPGMTVAQMVNASGSFANSWCEPLPVENIRLVLPGVTGRAYTLRGGKVQAQPTADGLELTLDTLRDYEAIVVEQ